MSNKITIHMPMVYKMPGGEISAQCDIHFDIGDYQISLAADNSGGADRMIRYYLRIFKKDQDVTETIYKLFQEKHGDTISIVGSGAAADIVSFDAISFLQIMEIVKTL